MHVRPSGDAFWPSEYAPWSEWLTGRRDGSDPGWDPMEFMVAEAHARNLEFHAWFNPYRGTQPGPTGPGADFDQARARTIRCAQHRGLGDLLPEGQDGAGSTSTRASRRPASSSRTRCWRRSQKYDVDGVHFDDFFYPYPEAGQDFPDDASFATYGAGRRAGRTGGGTT